MTTEFRYIIPEIPPSNNVYMGRVNHFAYQNDKKAWMEKVFFLCRPRPKKPIYKSIVKLTYYFKDKRRHDPDNYSGKFILDGLVRSGIIVDDSFDHIKLLLESGYDKEKPRTEILIKELQHD